MNFNLTSKSSLRSSSSSNKSVYQSEEIKRLQNIIETLKYNNDTLKKSLESRDNTIATLAREKEKLYEELKCAQRTNRNLYQQLTDERDIHFKEKEYLVHDIKRLSIRRESNFNLEAPGDKLFSSLEEEIHEKDEIIYNICTKYLKIKSSKIILQKKFHKLQKQSQKICENILLILQENKKALDTLLIHLLKMSNISRSSKKFIKLLKINARLHYENTQLKIRMTCGKEVNLNKGLSLPNFTFLRYANPDENDIHDYKPKKLLLRRSLSTNVNNFLRNSEDSRNFKCLRNSLSPHFRKPIYRSKSDSNLIDYK